jgi:triosephosphate isomerase
MAEHRRRLIAGNWKMNGLFGLGRAELGKLARKAMTAGRQDADIVICPPATLLRPFAELLGEVRAGRRIALGGQDCHGETAGAHTGDLSAEMLRDAGARYVIVGHSERRAEHGEGNAIVRNKVAAAHRAGLVAILCIGETAAERADGRALATVKRQLLGSLPESASAINTVIAYEPVWAIGSGKTPTGPDIVEIHAAIRETLATRWGRVEKARILYGGSVKPDNASVLLGLREVDGALVGGASLKAADFWPIVIAAG